MATLFIILFIFAMFHFIYESILSPMFRLEIRYKLFETRDKLRNLKLTHGEKFNDESFELLDDYASRTISMLPFYTLSNLIYVSRVKIDEETKERIHQHERLIKESEIPELKNINKNITRSGVYSLLINSGGWVYIIVPILLVVLIFSLITHTYSNLKVKLIKNSYKMSYTGNASVYNSSQLMYDI